MATERKERLAERIEDSTVESVQTITCPACSGGLTIAFVPAGRTGKGAGSLYVTCFKCMWRVIATGLRRPPVWVKKLGCKIQTVSKAAPPSHGEPSRQVI